MTLHRPPTPPSSLLPRILDDTWDPPPRVSRSPVGITAAVVVTACIAVVVVRAILSTSDPTPVGRDPYAYARSAAAAPAPAAAPDADRLTARRFADSLEPAFAPPGLWRGSTAPPAAAPAPTPPPAPPAARAVRAVRPFAKPVAPSPPGYLAVNSTPWAELRVDGQVVGNTPQLRITVKPGPHQLMFSRDGFETRRTWVTVESGATVRITDITLKRIAP